MVWAMVHAAVVVAGLWLPVLAYSGFHLDAVFLALTLYNAINVLICLWELCLFLYTDKIQREYTTMLARLGPNKLPSPLFLFEDMPVGEALKLSSWTKVWSTYSLIDRSYMDPTTFGFWIDSGNGVSTLLPSLLLMGGYASLAFPARVVGLIGACKYWQECYGAVVYYTTYFFNKRYQGRPHSHLLIVLFANSIWVIFPLVGLYASTRMVMEGTFAVLGN
eukprot:m.42110 g.42110  ORF g.42110 m.42110 type:complete len:220 (-) comp11516_c0_seq1:170-829(-)